MQTDRTTGSSRPVDETAVRMAIIDYTHDIDRAIELGYQGENLETSNSFYRYEGKQANRSVE